jgi:hypothetical protein
MRSKFAFALLIALPGVAVAQNRSDAAKAKAALAPFAKLVGTWEGDARVTLVPGQPAQVVRQVETITLSNDGTILKVHGVGRAAEGEKKGSIVFEANATAWFDAQQNKLRMVAKTATGDSTEASLEFRPDTLIWGFPIQGGRVRFTIHYTDTDWHEVGHWIAPNGQAIPTLDMRLKKKK